MKFLFLFCIEWVKKWLVPIIIPTCVSAILEAICYSFAWLFSDVIADIPKLQHLNKVAEGEQDEVSFDVYSSIDAKAQIRCRIVFFFFKLLLLW